MFILLLWFVVFWTASGKSLRFDQNSGESSRPRSMAGKSARSARNGRARGRPEEGRKGLENQLVKRKMQPK